VHDSEAQIMSGAFNSGPALIGQLPLEALDLVVNPLAGTLTGNPAHGGEHVLELL
jgi:hypothetical protein